MTSSIVRLVVAGVFLSSIDPAYALSALDLAASFNLTHTKVLSFPPSPVNQNDGATFITQNSWGVKRISNNPQNVQFVTNPFTQSNAPGVAVGNPGGYGTVMAVNYPQGSFSHDTGGIQFNSAYEEGDAPFQSMMLSYEVAFSENFQFVKGGKLPGLRGGPQGNGCSGGNQANGEDCFSMRLMWRPLGSGELYAYIPTPNDLCYQDDVRCNSDGFGTSIDRATFSFKPGEWTRITMLVTLNDPQYANGELWVYFNDLLAVRKQNLYYRSSKKIESVTGMYFSTFFGGNDASWATPVSQNTYYRNMQLWAGTAPSNVTGAQPVKSFSSDASGRWSSLGGSISLLLMGVLSVLAMGTVA